MKFEAAEVRVERLRTGKRSEALRARLVQDGEDLLAASLWMAADEMEGLEHDHTAAPEVPAPDRLKSYADIFDDYAQWYPYWRSVEARPSNVTDAPAAPTWRTWVRFASPSEAFDAALAAARAVFWMDLGPWNAAVRPHAHPTRYLAPNLDLHVQFHNLPRQGEWTLIESEAPLARGGLIGTSVRAFSEAGEIIASGGSMLFCRRNTLYEEQLRRLQARAAAG